MFGLGWSRPVGVFICGPLADRLGDLDGPVRTCRARGSRGPRCTGSCRGTCSWGRAWRTSGASFTTESKSSSSRYAPRSARLASSTSGFLGVCGEGTTWIIRIVWRRSSEQVTAAASASSRRRVEVRMWPSWRPRRGSARGRRSRSRSTPCSGDSRCRGRAGRPSRRGSCPSGGGHSPTWASSRVAGLDDRPEDQVRAARARRCLGTPGRRPGPRRRG